MPAFAAWAGCATPTGSAGHAGATANLKLTFHLDRSAGADHWLDEIAAGTVTDVEQIAAREKCSLRKVNMTSRSPFSHPIWSKRPSKVACRADLELPVSAIARLSGPVSTGCSVFQVLSWPGLAFARST